MQIKQIIGATGFFSAGALIAWAVTADRYDRMVSDISDRVDVLAEIVNTRSGNDNEIEPVTEKDSDEADPNQPTLLDELKLRSVHIHPEPNIFGETIQLLDVDDEPDTDEPEPFPEGETPEETRTNLQGLIDKYTANPQDRDDFVRQVSRSNGDHKPPYVISRDEYAYGEDGASNAKITLTYYPRHRVLLEDDDDPVEDVPGTIGWRSLSNFGGESGDPDVVFVRNDRLMSDFEIIKEEDSELPLHVKYGMSKEEFRVNKAAGTLKLRREDE